MKRSCWITTFVMVAMLALGLGVVTPAGFAQEPARPAENLENVFPKKAPYSPYAGRHFP